MNAKDEMSDEDDEQCLGSIEHQAGGKRHRDGS